MDYGMPSAMMMLERSCQGWRSAVVLHLFPYFLYFVAPLLVEKLEYLRIIGKSDAELLVASNQFGTNTYYGDGPILMWPATVLRPLFGEYRSMKILNPVSINLCGLRCLIFAPKLQHMILIEYALGLSLHWVIVCQWMYGFPGVRTVRIDNMR